MSGKDDFKKLVRESGNNFHCEVVNFLRGKEWETLVSAYYLDSATDKPREIDLIAEKAWVIPSDSGKVTEVVIRLFIECKYISQINAFWFSKMDVESAKKWIAKQHHYLAHNTRVAKLFASKNKPNMESEVIFKALNQCLNSMVYLRGRPFLTVRPSYPGRPVKRIEMPMILCNSFSNFCRVDIENQGEPEVIDKNFLLEVNYAYIDQAKNSRNEYFLIDVVDFSKMDDFLEVLENDINAIRHIII